MKTVIIYYSKHHGNTKKLLDAICEREDVELIDASAAEDDDIHDYDLIGFASGIYFGKFHKSVIKFAERNLPEDKKVFFIYTCGSKKKSYTKLIRQAAEKKNANILGTYGCRGYDTFGPFKLVGGLAVGHPNRAETAGASAFYRKVKEKAKIE